MCMVFRLRFAPKLLVLSGSHTRAFAACQITHKQAPIELKSPIKLPELNYTEESCFQEAIFTYTNLMQVCTKRKSLTEGLFIHTHILNSGLEPHVFLGTTLVNMYTQCGRIDAARQVFDKLSNPDLLTWNMMILAYGKDSSAEEAFKLLVRMQDSGIKPNEFTFVGILTAAAKLLDLEKGQQVHSHIVKIGLRPNVFMYNALMDVYTKCGSMHDAWQVFDGIDERDVVSWNTMIGAWTKHSSVENAFAFFRQMVLEGWIPNEITFLSLMNACAILSNLELSKQVHLQVITVSVKLSRSINNTLIDMYSKCGSMKNAWKTFDSMFIKDEVAWNAIIGGYSRNGCANEVIVFFLRMADEGVNANEITFLSVLHACATSGNLKQAKQIHACVGKAWVESNVVICSALVDMYAKCGELQDAKELFNRSSKQNVVLWTVIIAGYAKHGHAEEAFRLFGQMQLRGVNPNEVTFVSILDACSCLGCPEEGQLVHTYIVEKGFKSHLSLENALVNVYIKSGCLDDACKVFDSMEQRDTVSYTAILAGYTSNELFGKAFGLFKEMIQQDVEPDHVTSVIMNAVCANSAALEQGRLIHFYIVNSGVLVDAFVGNALIDMYAKCGSLEEAQYVLDRLANRDIVSWNTMVSGCSQHGQGKDLLMLVGHMEKDGMRLNHITSLCLLSICGRSGLVAEGVCLLNYMLEEYLFTLIMVEHYACMADLLGRAGHLSQALQFIERMPFQPTATVWGALLGACKLHGFVALADSAAEEIFQLEPQNVAVFVVLSNIYATV